MGLARELNVSLVLAGQKLGVKQRRRRGPARQIPREAQPRQARPLGITVAFGGDRINFRTTDVATVEEFKSSLAAWQVMREQLRGGSMTLAGLAAEHGKSLRR